MSDTPTPSAPGDALLPCPFCGADDAGLVRQHTPTSGRTVALVRCGVCEASIPQQRSVPASDALAADAWNMRHAPAPDVRGLLAEADAVLSEVHAAMSEDIMHLSLPEQVHRNCIGALLRDLRAAATAPATGGSDGR